MLLFQFAYNFERVWYLCSDGNWQLVSQLMKEVETDGKTKIPDSLLKQVLFFSSAPSSLNLNYPVLYKKFGLTVGCNSSPIMFLALYQCRFLGQVFPALLNSTGAQAGCDTQGRLNAKSLVTVSVPISI